MPSTRKKLPTKSVPFSKSLTWLASIVFGLLFAAFPAFSYTVDKQFEETAYNLKDLCMVNANVGWAVGAPHWSQTEKIYKGTIIKTVDGGISWSAQEAGSTASFRSVSFVDANNGWVSGANGTILHTANGGNTWVRQTVATTDGIRDITFSDALNGWAISYKPVHVDLMGSTDDWRATIWHTVNGGSTWTSQTLPPNASILHGLKFINNTTGWAVGTKCTVCTGDNREHVAVVYHTTNGGTTWTEQWSPDLNLVFTAVEFADASHGWVTGFKGSSGVHENPVFHTADGGATWERQSTANGFHDPPGGSVYDPLWDIQFIDANRGYMVGFNYSSAWGPPVWRTMDGGGTWEKVHMAKHESNGLFGVAVTATRVVALGDYDYIIISDDPWGAFPWPQGENLFSQAFIDIHYRFEDVFFTDQNHGWAVGRRSFGPEMNGQIIINTQNGGATWTEQYEHAPNLTDLYSHHRLDSVFFVDNQNGWAVGDSVQFTGSHDHHGAIMHTADGGQTWQEQGQGLYEGRDREFLDIQFLDSQNGWALADLKFPSNNIHMVHTTDGGLHWQWVDTGIERAGMCGSANHVQGGIHFTNPQHGWAVGDSGVVNTVDGGVTWTDQTSADTLPLFDTDFLNNQEGWIVRSSGKALHTIDGGLHWIQEDINISEDLLDVQVFENGTGWIVGEGGNIMYMTHHGSHFYQLNSGTWADLLGLSFIDHEKGWIVGDHGTIIKLTLADADGDGREDFEDNCPNLANLDQADFDSDGKGDVCDSDDDNDGMPDLWENSHGLNSKNAADRDEDPDGDGFTNYQEFQFRTDPQVFDADDNNNGIPDVVEQRRKHIVPILELLLRPPGTS